SRKEVLEDDHFVFSWLRVGVHLRWNMSKARSQYPLVLHFSKHRQSHLRRTEEGGRRELALLRSHRRTKRVRRGANNGRGAKTETKRHKSRVKQESSAPESKESVPSPARA